MAEKERKPVEPREGGVTIVGEKPKKQTDQKQEGESDARKT